MDSSLGLSLATASVPRETRDVRATTIEQENFAQFAALSCGRTLFGLSVQEQCGHTQSGIVSSKLLESGRNFL